MFTIKRSFVRVNIRYSEQNLRNRGFTVTSFDCSYNNSNNSIFNFGSGDLSMDNSYISCNNNNYSKQVNLLNNNINYFNASEIEAFKVQFNSNN